jgi:hypothetical protein
MQNKLRLWSREQVAIIGVMPNLLTILTEDCSALEEEVTITSASITGLFLCFLLCIWLVLNNSTRVGGRALSLVCFFVTKAIRSSLGGCSRASTALSRISTSPVTRSSSSVVVVVLCKTLVAITLTSTTRGVPSRAISGAEVLRGKGSLPALYDLRKP